MKKQTLPCDDMAERATLGAMICCGVDGMRDVLDRITAAVNTADYLSERHVLIHDAIAGLAREHDHYDATQIIAKLRDTGNLDRAGGADYLIELVDGVATAHTGPAHAQRVRECAIRRRLMSGAEALNHAASNGHALDDVLTEADRLAALIADARRTTRSGAAVTINLCDVQAEPIRWLWHPRIALGKLTLIAGDPGLGKSFLTMDLAGRVSTGNGWPDLPGVRFDPGGVVLLSAEDDIADTIRPRLDAAGADVSRIVALSAINTAKGARTFDLMRDLAALEQVITNRGDVRLIVVDPITAYCGKADSHNNTEVRGLLAPLSELASRHRVAVVAVTHLNKSGAGPAIYRAMGSLAFTAAARAVWAVTRDKHDDDRRLLLPVKNNIGTDRSGLAFALRTAADAPAPAIVWEADPVTLDVDEALATEPQRPGPGADEREAAMQWLRDTLADGPQPAKELIADAREAVGVSEKTLRRAKDAIGAEAYRPENPGPWCWRLASAGDEPDHVPPCHE